MTVRRIEEHIVDRHRLGRHVEHDPRSRAFAFPARSAESLVTTQHRRRIAVLDQGDLGSCTGNAGVGSIGTHPLFGRLPADHPALNQALAVKFYTAATKIDGVPGEMPSEDTGSTGLAVAKVMLQAELIRGYQHTFDLDSALHAIVRQSVMVGSNWYEGMDRPDWRGTVRASGEVRGGHEYVVDGIDVENRLVWATNSWSKYWGLGGRFNMSWDTFERLLDEQGDVVVPLRLRTTSVSTSLCARLRALLRL